LPLSHARRIVSVIDKDNQDHWLGLATSLSEKNLRREVARVRPEEEERAQFRPIRDGRTLLQMGISWKLEDKLKRICDLLSQRLRRPVNQEEAMDYLADGFLEKEDPIQKAERNKLCVHTKPEKIRPGRFTSASTKHAVNLRDRGRCVFIYPDGTRCEEERWIERHHPIPVAQGGLSTEDNLETLCSFHHRYLHRTSAG
jgi:HNH endonuclease